MVGGVHRRKRNGFIRAGKAFMNAVTGFLRGFLTLSAPYRQTRDIASTVSSEYAAVSASTAMLVPPPSSTALATSAAPWVGSG